MKGKMEGGRSELKEERTSVGERTGAEFFYYLVGAEGGWEESLTKGGREGGDCGKCDRVHGR